jgi:hypothetical protein
MVNNNVVSENRRDFETNVRRDYHVIVTKA